MLNDKAFHTVDAMIECKLVVIMQLMKYVEEIGLMTMCPTNSDH